MSRCGLPVTGLFLALDRDGYSLPIDWYLQLSGAGAKMFTGQIPASPVSPLQ